MTSKELNEILNKTRRTKDINLSAEQVEELIKDLDKLEQIKILLSKYNNDEMHFTRGFDFINIVKEVLGNDK